MSAWLCASTDAYARASTVHNFNASAWGSLRSAARRAPGPASGWLTRQQFMSDRERVKDGVRIGGPDVQGGTAGGTTVEWCGAHAPTKGAGMAVGCRSPCAAPRLAAYRRVRVACAA